MYTDKKIHFNTYLYFKLFNINIFRFLRKTIEKNLIDVSI